MWSQLGFVILSVALIAAATVGLCTGHLSGTEWIGVAGPTGVLGAAAHYLSSSTTPG